MFLATLLVSLVFGALGSTAIASRGEVTYFEAPALLLDPSTRPTTLAALQRLGVRALRVELRWHDVAPRANSRRKPSFDPTNPAAYHWGQYDALIEAAHQLGWKILLTPTSPVPRWATADPRHDSLVTRPSSSQFERFMTPVGRHFGAELDRAAGAGALPAHLPIYVTEFGIISKPNRYQGVSATKQAEWDAISERIAYLNPRVASFCQYLLRDDPIRHRSVGFQTGLEYVTGKPKPLLKGFAVPLVVRRHGGRYTVWGLVRPSRQATTLPRGAPPRG